MASGRIPPEAIWACHFLFFSGFLTPRLTRYTEAPRMAPSAKQPRAEPATANKIGMKRPSFFFKITLRQWRGPTPAAPSAWSRSLQMSIPSSFPPLPLPNSPVNRCHESQCIPSGAIRDFRFPQQLRRQRNVRRLYGHVNPSSRCFVFWSPPGSCCGPCAATASRRNPG